MPRGRKRASWQTLKDSGCKPHRWKKRKAEDEAALLPPPVIEAQPTEFIPDPEAVAQWVARWNRENQTFETRRVDGETVTRQYGGDFEMDGDPSYRRNGAHFNFPQGHVLTICRNYCRSMLAGNGPDVLGEYSKDLCTTFLHDLETGSARGFYMDVEAATNAHHMLSTFGKPGELIKFIRLVAIVEFWCWKTADGEYRFPDEGLLGFHPDDIKTQDAALCALKAAGL